MRSAIYDAVLEHERDLPARNAFRYRTYQLLLDLDELAELARTIPELSINRRNLVELRSADHLGDPALSIRQNCCAILREHGVEPPDGRIELLTNARTFGHVFNPVSFYFVRDRRDGALRTVLAEVHNTHGEEHVYHLDRVGDGDVYVSHMDKVLYVSPFIDMDARYVFECREGTGGAYDLRIDEYQGDELFFQAQLRLKPRPLTNANVARMLARYPLMTLKTIGLIHWQGLKLWLRGVKFHAHKPHEEAGR